MTEPDKTPAGLTGGGPGHGLMAPAIAVESVPIVGAASYDANGRRRVHQLTPLVHLARAVPVLVVLGFSVGGPLLSVAVEAAILAVVVTVLVVAAVVGLMYLSWSRLTYWFDDDGDLRVDSGVLSRHERRLQLSRLQSVDVEQPLIARLVGMAEVRVEVAGSGDSRVVLQFLTASDAAALRSEILARSAGVRHDAGEAPEDVIITVPPEQLLVSLLLTATPWVMFGIGVLLIVVTFLTAGWAGLLLLFLGGGVPILYIFNTFAAYYGFTLAESPDGLRIRRGLLRTTAQTVPPGRVHAVGLVEPLLWRRRGWVRVRVNIAGASHRGGGDAEQTETLLLPVAPWPVAREVLARILPGVDLDAIELDPVPASIKWRAPIQWRSLAVGHDESVLVTRRGRIVRETNVIPHARTQSVRLRQGPWSRRLGVASVHVDTVPGRVAVVAHYRPEHEARALVLEQAERARLARGTDASTRWMTPPTQETP